MDPTLLGLSASHAAIHLDDLVAASRTTVNIGTAAAPNVVDALQLTTTMYNEVSIKSPYSKQRSAARWGVQVLAVDTTVTAANGSDLLSVLGFGGINVNPHWASEGLVGGTPLHGQTLDDRFFIEDAGISAAIDLSIDDVTVEGSLGFLSFSGSGHGHVGLAADLMLQTPDGSGTRHVGRHRQRIPQRHAVPALGLQRPPEQRQRPRGPSW